MSKKLRSLTLATTAAPTLGLTAPQAHAAPENPLGSITDVPVTSYPQATSSEWAGILPLLAAFTVICILDFKSCLRGDDTGA